MHGNFREKLNKFVAEEQQAPLDANMLTRLKELAMQDTLYFTLKPIDRNTYNAYFKYLHDTLDAELLSGKYGASVIIDSIIVTAFESGMRWGQLKNPYKEEGSD